MNREHTETESTAPRADTRRDAAEAVKATTAAPPPRPPENGAGSSPPPPPAAEPEHDGRALEDDRAPERERAVPEDDDVPLSAEATEAAGEDEGALAELRRAVEAGNERLAALEAVFREKHLVDENREKLVNRLHDELQEYKQGMIDQIVRPIALELVGFYDDLGKDVATCRELADQADAADEVAGKVVKRLEDVREGIEILLFKQGVESFEVEGEEFDGKRQRPIRTVPTDDPARDRLVAERLRKGFLQEERVVRPEWVTVYKYEPPAAAEPVEAATEVEESAPSERVPVAVRAAPVNEPAAESPPPPAAETSPAAEETGSGSEAASAGDADTENANRAT